MVLARLQVFTTRFSFLLFRICTLSIRASWTNGPFLTLLAMPLPRRLSALAPANDQLGGRLLPMTGLAALRLAPGGNRGTPARALALTAAQRVVHRVHGHAADLGPLAQPAALPGLAHREQLVLGVPHLAH